MALSNPLAGRFNLEDWGSQRENYDPHYNVMFDIDEFNLTDIRGHKPPSIRLTYEQTQLYIIERQPWLCHIYASGVVQGLRQDDVVGERVSMNDLWMHDLWLVGYQFTVCQDIAQLAWEQEVMELEIMKWKL